MISPTKNSPINEIFNNIWEKIEKYLGRTWKTIHRLPTCLYKTMVLIKNLISESRIFSSCDSTSGEMSKNVKKEKVPDLTFVLKVQKQNEWQSEQQIEENEIDLADLLGDVEDQEDPIENQPDTPSKPSSNLDFAKDPLKSLGALTPQAKVQLEDQAPSNIQQIKLENEQGQLELVEKEILSNVQDLVENAQILLSQMKEQRAGTLQDDREKVQKLNDEAEVLELYAKEFEKSSPEAHRLIQKTLQELEKMIVTVEKRMFNKVRRFYIRPAQTSLRQKEKLIKLEDYLKLVERLNEKVEPLKAFQSQFERHLPNGHRLVQKTRAKLEERVTELEREMCDFMKNNYQPNRAIPGDGNCLFWSVGNLLSPKSDQKHYRQLAADYIRSHRPEFDEGIKDVMQYSAQAQGVLRAYEKVQGGREAWQKNLTTKLKQEPTDIDFYCDCLENSTLWGGVNELFALSEQLKVPIMVFTLQNNGKDWRYDLKIGQDKFKDTPPVLLYYNGNSHYQSLIPRS
jgi:hypothetical protein